MRITYFGIDKEKNINYRHAVIVFKREEEEKAMDIVIALENDGFGSAFLTGDREYTTAFFMVDSKDEYDCLKARYLDYKRGVCEIPVKYWFSCESMEDSPCNDFFGTLSEACEYAQKYANELHKDIVVNRREDIVDFVYPDSEDEQEVSEPDTEETTPEHSENENERFKGVVFADNEHKQMFFGVLGRMNLEQKKDPWRESFAYLITLDTVCRQHISEMYNFSCGCIDIDCIESPWQTSSSLRTTLLAFNLFTGSLGWCPDELMNQCTPSEIFNDFEYPEYYWQAIKIRYTWIG